MKSCIITHFILLLSIHINAQLKIDAGNDTTVCSGYNYDGNDRISIGGNPTASGGVEPYTFTWSGNRKLFPLSNYTVYASDILDDTTKCNPLFKRDGALEEWFIFYLKVEDAENNIQYDSVKIRASRFIYSLVNASEVIIVLGDSIQLIGNPYIYSNFWPFTFTISPSLGLSDSTNIEGWAKPKINTLYYLKAVNSIGCISKKVPYLRIDVDTITSTNDIKTLTENKCFISKGDLILNQTHEPRMPYQVTITTIKGEIIHSGYYIDRNLHISNLKLSGNQIFLISILEGNERIIYKLINY